MPTVSQQNSSQGMDGSSANVDGAKQQNSLQDEGKPGDVIRVLYLFSGKSRKGSVSHWCSKLAKRHSTAVEVEMVDVKVKPHVDLTLKSNRDKILEKIKLHKYDVIILSPPCSTFSRAPWSNRKGPRPIRSFLKPKGLERLSWAERKKANWGNTLKDFTFEALLVALEAEVHMILFENPEDLGALQHGPYAGQRPASMWQDDRFREMLADRLVQTVAFYQQDFGTDYLKPTRLLLRGFDIHDSFLEGPANFDDQGFYSGPLQKRAATKQLIGQQHSLFNTTGSEQWPTQFCKWVAQQILLKVTCRVPGKVRDFHDGAGLASPGRWDVERRRWSGESWIVRLRAELLKMAVTRCGGFNQFDKVCFDMSVKGEAGCELVKDEKFKMELLERMVNSLAEEGVDVQGLLHIAEGQPFRLRLMQKLLQQLGDSDHLFLLDGEVGFPVGVLHQLPRTPHMYEEQTSWKLEDDPYMKSEIWRENYDSVQNTKPLLGSILIRNAVKGLCKRWTSRKPNPGLVIRSLYLRYQSWWRRCMATRRESFMMLR